MSQLEEMRNLLATIVTRYDTLVASYEYLEIQADKIALLAEKLASEQQQLALALKQFFVAMQTLDDLPTEAEAALDELRTATFRIFEVPDQRFLM